MSIRSTRLRRGAALLITLAAMVLILTAAATAARIAATSRLAMRIDEATLLADDVLAACEQPIHRWLTKKSSSVVLPPDVRTPSLTILHDRIQISRDTIIEIAIDAYDQLGMAPLQVARSGSPLRMALPEEILDVIDTCDLPKDAPSGLDLFASSMHSSNIRIFPAQLESQAVEFAAQPPHDSPSSALAYAPDPAPSLGALIATHNSMGDTPGGGRINVNTAPIGLLEVALRAAGRGGIDQIIAARMDGRPASVGSLPSHDAPRDDAAKILLTGVSDVWSFRIDIKVNTMQRSWWVIYQKLRSKWHCVQRLAIDE